jgi:hypothetical protein
MPKDSMTGDSSDYSPRPSDGTEFSPLPIVAYSPVEFVVIGPRTGRDRVSVRSKESRIDTLGFGITALERSSDISQADDYFNLFTYSNYAPKFVKSGLIADSDRSTDYRKSQYILVWKGYASSIGIERIRQAFAFNVEDLRKGISNKNSEIVQLACNLRVSARAQSQTSLPKGTRGSGANLFGYRFISPSLSRNTSTFP